MLADSTAGRCGSPAPTTTSGALCWRDLVARGAERGKVVRADVLHLVDEHADTDGQVVRQVGRVGEQLDQVHLEITRVGPALRGDDVDRWVPADALAIVLRGPQREGLQDSAELVDPFVVAVPVTEFAHRGVHRLRDRQPDALVRAGLDLAGAPRALDRLAPQRVEQHGLADATQPGQHQAPLWPTCGDPLEHHLELPHLGVASGQLRRPLTGAGRIGIPDRIHAFHSMRVSSVFLRFR